MKTKVKVEFFKYTGKYYDSFEFETNLPVWSVIEIKSEVNNSPSFLSSMDYTIEASNGGAWNKYLFIANSKKKIIWNYFYYLWHLQLFLSDS